MLKIGYPNLIATIYGVSLEFLKSKLGLPINSTQYWNITILTRQSPNLIPKILLQYNTLIEKYKYNWKLSKRAHRPPFGTLRTYIHVQMINEKEIFCINLGFVYYIKPHL